MKLTCSRRELNDAVQTVARAAAAQSSLPILSHLLFAVEAGRLVLTATDQDLSVRTSIPVQADGEDALAVPARPFGEILASMPDGVVEIEIGSRQVLTVQLGEIHFELKGLAAVEFPGIPVVHLPGDEAIRIQLDQKTMRRMLRQTLFAVGQEPARVQYTGVLFEQEAHAFRMVASDGVVRLSVSCSVLDDPASPISAIVPGRTVQEMYRLLKADSEEPVTLFIRNDAMGPTLASFETGSVLMVSRLIEGQFAAWRRVVPGTWSRRVTIKSGDLMGALRRVSILARDDQQRVQLTLSRDALQLSGVGSYGAAVEKIPALGEGDDLLIALDGRYLAEGVAALDEEGCRIDLMTPLSPCVIRPLEGDSYLYVQSPMHPR